MVWKRNTRYAYHRNYSMIPDKNKSHLPIRKTFYGNVLRTAQEMYEHTKNVNSYHFGEIRIEIDNNGSILDCRRRGFEILENKESYLNNHVSEGGYNEQWSLRKMFDAQQELAAFGRTANPTDVFVAVAMGKLMPKVAESYVVARSVRVSFMSRYQGNHSVFNDFVWDELNRMDINLSASELEKQVYNLQQKSKSLMEHGLPTYPKEAASTDLWKRWYDKK